MLSINLTHATSGLDHIFSHFFNNFVYNYYSYVASGDETPILRAGYWASYNVPFFEKVYNLSGYPEAANKMGPDVTHQLCPRAKIFRRDQSNVTDLSSMEYIMRYNSKPVHPLPP